MRPRVMHVVCLMISVAVASSLSAQVLKAPLAAGGVLGAAQSPEGVAPGKFRRVEEMIPMRDGTRLQTVIFTPVAGTPALPILLTRTP